MNELIEYDAQRIDVIDEVMSVMTIITMTRTPPVEASSRGRSNSGLLSVQRKPVDHAHHHWHILELTCDFNSSRDVESVAALAAENVNVNLCAINPAEQAVGGK